MNHLNEYRLFKGRKNSWSPKLGEPKGNQQYYYQSGSYDNKKDPDEPFFMGPKARYKGKKAAEFITKADELNVPIKKDMYNKMGITDEMIDKIKPIGHFGAPTYNKDNQTYHVWISIDNYDETYATIVYFVPENDYIVKSPDYNGKNLKKKFDNASDCVDWILSCYQNKGSVARQKMREIKESNEPGVDVFNLKGIDKKLNNLLGFDDFEKTFKPKEQKSTKRTDVGLDILNENKKKYYYGK